MARNVDGMPVYGNIVGVARPNASLRVLKIDSVEVLWPQALAVPSDYRIWALVEAVREKR